ncbi:MAG TPA: thioredoxin-disulfide reductase [Candidatus Tectomicrobia bacterium]|jgi:thioredoxin reductase (NADPH)|nr:thioredoxin-disulfide reductase [Candidatus Tectomicrobia bacterium]
MHEVVILGAGPAGLTAAIYAARANLAPIVITGPLFGGQLALTTDVENFPGFPDGVLGPELMELMKRQAERFGAEVRIGEVTEVGLTRYPLRVTFNGELLETKSLIVATGATARLLGVPGEEALYGRGVSTCATCDGFFYRGKTVMVVGGGDSAVEEGTFLTRYASKVYLVHRRDRLRASQILQDRAMKNEKMSFIWDTVVEEIIGDEDSGVAATRLRNVKTGAEEELPVDGVFIAIGHTPTTKLFEGQLKLDEQGYIVTDSRMHTNLKGVFACGDCQDHIYRQAITAAGTGCMAAMEAEKFLADVEERAYPA